jgi:hypothetical protein
MRDLYRRLKLRRTASTDQLRTMLSVAAIAQTPEGQAAKAILLDSGRRAQYDRVHHAMSQIAQLRRAVGIEHTGYASSGAYVDFLSPSATKQAPQAPTTPRATQAKPEALQAKGTNGGCLFLMILVFGLAAVLFIISESGILSRSTSAPKLHWPTNPQPLPVTGYGDTSRSTTENAIIITTRGDRHTLVKIVDIYGQPVTSGFIRAGESYRFNLPRNTYRLKTATGSTWYGEKHLFGKDTSYAMAEDLFPLERAGERWTVELIPQRQGNMRERRIQASDF